MNIAPAMAAPTTRMFWIELGAAIAFAIVAAVLSRHVARFVTEQ